MEVFKYLNEFTTASARWLFDYDLNDRTGNNGAKLIVKHFNTSVAKHFYPIKITGTSNALASDVVSSRTVNSFEKWTQRSVLLLLSVLEFTLSLYHVLLFQIPVNSFRYQ